MINGDEQRDQRAFVAEVYGDNPEEMELAALDEAVEFFGAERRFAIVPDYAVARPASPGTLKRAEELGGKKYRALIRVRITNP